MSDGEVIESVNVIPTRESVSARTEQEEDIELEIDGVRKQNNE
jgi:hypothetical protein